MACNKSIKLPRFTQADIERFHSRVNKTPGQGPKGECWTWTMRGGVRRYGKFTVTTEERQYTISAHRAAYFLEYGIDPVDLLVCHSCDFKPCVRGAHLFSGDNADNSADMCSKGRSASGDRHPSRAQPETLKRGKDHWTNQHPEWISGERNPAAILTADKVRELRALYAMGRTGQSLAVYFGISKSTASAIIRREIWKDIH